MEKENSNFLLINVSVLPEIFLKVVEAKKLLATHTAASAAEATRLVGISRSAFYKYKDSVYAYKEGNTSKMISLHLILQDKPGILMSMLSSFYKVGANILTVNQNIPISGTALVSVSADIEGMTVSLDDFLAELRSLPGVDKIENIVSQ